MSCNTHLYSGTLFDHYYLHYSDGVSSHVSEQLDEPSLPVSGIHECILVGKEELEREQGREGEKGRGGGTTVCITIIV